MREILFRGKRRDNREWVFGCYYKQTEFYGDKLEPFGIMIITSSESLCYDQALEYYAISEKTVGQFTGLTDKNGKKIFEGDILSENGSLFSVIFDQKWARFHLQYIGRGIQYPEWNRGVQMEVIGNIHDNPELLEVDHE